MEVWYNEYIVVVLTRDVSYGLVIMASERNLRYRGNVVLAAGKAYRVI